VDRFKHIINLSKSVIIKNIYFYLFLRQLSGLKNIFIQTTKD